MNTIKTDSKVLDKTSIEKLRERYDESYRNANGKMKRIEERCHRHSFSKVFKEIFSIVLFLIITYGLVILKNIEYSVTSGEMKSFSEIIEKMID